MQKLEELISKAENRLIKNSGYFTFVNEQSKNSRALNIDNHSGQRKSFNSIVSKGVRLTR